MERVILIVVLFLAFPLFFSFAQNTEYTLYINSDGIVKELTLGYHPFATDGIDTALGEINLPPYTPNQFDARFRLFDTTLSTHKDFRFGCYWGGSLHLLEWKYGYNIIITGGRLINNNFSSLIIVNPNDGSYLANFTSLDSICFVVPTGFDYLVIRSESVMPLSWPSYNINSIKQGDLIPAGSSKLLSWTQNLGFPGYTDITISTDNGESWSYIAQGLPHSQSSFNWSVPNINSNRCIIRVGEYPCIYDEVGTFFIYQGSIPQLFPIFIPFNLRNGNNEIVNLTASLHPQATSGLDTILGEIIHNFQPQGIFDAAFILYNAPHPIIYSRKDIQFGHNLVFGRRNFYFHVQPSPDSIVIFESSLPANIFAEIKYDKVLPYGIVHERKYLGTGNINYQLPKSSLSQYSLFDLEFFFDNIVPVEFLSFIGSATDNGALLEWTTITEMNNHGFEIQRKLINGDFSTIGFVKGSGTTTTPTNYFFVDRNTESGNYFYRLKQVDYNGSYEYSSEIEINIAPAEFELFQNYPNPFNPTTKIMFAIPLLGGDERGGLVTLKVYDILGREVATLVNEEKTAGTYNVEFRIENGELSSGVYFYQLKAGNFLSTKKMILLR